MRSLMRDSPLSTLGTCETDGRRLPHDLLAPEVAAGVVVDATSPGMRGKWQATRWPGAISRGSGSSVAQRSAASGQRVRNRQPDGGLIGDGGSPLIVAVARPAPGSVDGIDSSSALV